MNTWRTPVIAVAFAVLVIALVFVVLRVEGRSSRDFENHCYAKGGTVEYAEEAGGRHKVRWCSDEHGRMI